MPGMLSRGQDGSCHQSQCHSSLSGVRTLVMVIRPDCNASPLPPSLEVFELLWNTQQGDKAWPGVLKKKASTT